MTRTKGIHTYWQNEPLKLRIKKNCQEGYYRFAFKGMNFAGPLPDFYKAFTIGLKRDGEDVGAVLLPASDTLYATGTVTLYLKKGDNEFDVVWLNDAYKENVYDANLQLNSVSMSFVPNYQPPTRLSKSSREFCQVDGRFFVSDKSVWTSQANQQISYCYPALRSGKYEVQIRAHNHGKLPQGYDSFHVNVSADGVEGTVNVPASAEKSQTGKTVLDLTEGDKKLDIKWTNDISITEELDSAIELDSITLRRVGDSDRSRLAASLLSSGLGQKAWIIAIVAALLSALALGMLRRFRAS